MDVRCVEGDKVHGLSTQAYRPPFLPFLAVFTMVYNVIVVVSWSCCSCLACVVRTAERVHPVPLPEWASEWGLFSRGESSDLVGSRRCSTFILLGRLLNDGSGLAIVPASIWEFIIRLTCPLTTAICRDTGLVTTGSGVCFHLTLIATRG